MRKEASSSITLSSENKTEFFFPYDILKSTRYTCILLLKKYFYFLGLSMFMYEINLKEKNQYGCYFIYANN